MVWIKETIFRIQKLSCHLEQPNCRKKFRIFSLRSIKHQNCRIKNRKTPNLSNTIDGGRLDRITLGDMNDGVNLLHEAPLELCFF